MSDYLLIANPISGARRAPHIAFAVQRLLELAGKKVAMHVTGSRGDARQRAAAAAAQGVKVVVGCGGDGTLQEIATALDGTKTALGIIPRGRCNDFAHALGIEKTDSAEFLAKLLQADKRRTVDLGAVGDRRFLTVATLGFDSEASRYVEKHHLPFRGAPAYLYAVLRILLTYRFPHVKLRGDFGAFEGRILLTATGNAPCYGGAMQIAPGAKLDDGIFQTCIVEKLPRLTVLPMLPRVLKGTHTTHPKVRMASTRFLDVETPEGPQWVCADGETLCQTPCRFEIRPAALQVVVP